MARPRTRPSLGLLAAALLATTTACSKAAEVSTAGPAPAPPTTATTADSATKPTPTAPASPRTAPYLSSDELKRALLPKMDMPESWTTYVDTDPVPEGKDAAGDCARLTAMLNPSSGVFPVKGAASITARDPAPGGKSYAIFGVTLTSLTPGDAEGLILKARELVPRCPTERFSQEGLTGRLTTREIADPKLGDASMTAEVVTRLDNGQGWAHSIVLIRVGTTLIRVTHVNLTEPTPHHPDESLVRKQLDQVTAAMRAGGTG
ncbi:hypothetical protein ACFZBU_28380 [Embleya sp. NPDC008237]|uniref:hypothetical protein n=1 Tax=Embleya sp. NPDC008237 TaxID=3363978 RepID=UPI0036E1EE5A